MTVDSGPPSVPISDPVVSAVGATGVPTPGEAVMIAGLLSLEVDDPHPGICTFVAAATVVAFDAGCGVPATVSFVRQMREAYIVLLDEPPERYDELAPVFGEQFMAALRRRLPHSSDVDAIAAAGLPRYEYMMKVAATALNPSGTDSAVATGAE